MVQTRSGSASTGMAISTDIQEYFANLIEPLSTKDGLKKMFEEFKTEVLEKMEKKLEEQEERIVKLESSLAIRNNIIDKLLVSSDDNEQYSRRSCLRIHGITFDDTNKHEDIHAIIEKCYKEVNIDLKCDEIDRAHRIGKSYVEETSGKKVKSIIIKYKSWDARSRFYKARPKGFSDVT